MRDRLDEEKRLPDRQPLFVLRREGCEAGGPALAMLCRISAPGAGEAALHKGRLRELYAGNLEAVEVGTFIDDLLSEAAIAFELRFREPLVRG